MIAHVAQDHGASLAACPHPIPPPQAGEGARRSKSCRAHMTIVAFSFISARATLIAASAEVLGLLREGLPCSRIAKRPAKPSA